MNIQTRLSSEERQSLGEKLPLKQPYVLLVDPSNLCNLRCKWCPTGYDKMISDTFRNETVMNIELFKKILNDTKEFDNPFKVLRLYKEGEPLVNPSFAQMILLAKKSEQFLRIDTTTNGHLLSPELNRKIVDSGLDQINISVNGVTSEQIFKHTGRKIDFKEYVSNIRDLYKNRGNCTVYIKSIKDILTEKEQNLFFEIFGDISDRIFLERLSPAWPDFDVSLSGYNYENVGNYDHPVENRKVCPYLFYIMVINSDGSVSTCVGDWKHHQITGNINERSLKEIWLGEQQKHYQIQHLEGNKDCFEMCSKCKVISHGCYDNIDSYSEKIKTKIINNEFRSN